MNLININSLYLSPVTHCVFVSNSKRWPPVVDFINGNRKFNVSPDGTLLSHTTNPFTFHCGNLMSQSTERQKISTSGFHFWRPGRQRSRCLRSLLHFGWITPARENDLFSLAPGGRWIAGWDVDGGGGGVERYLLISHFKLDCLFLVNFPI